MIKTITIYNYFLVDLYILDEWNNMKD